MLESLVFIPRICGQPFYPDGFPLPPDKIFFKELTVRDVWLITIPKDVLPFNEDLPRKQLSKTQIQFVKEYLIYYAHAPCWYPGGAMDAVKGATWFIKTIEDIENVLILFMEAGLDPI